MPAEWTRYFLRLGTLGFGGPIALSAAMQRDLVEDRRWITPDEYKEGLALAQLAPGPLAAQLAIYLGWLRGGVLGATITGVAFVSPSFLMVLLLAWLYLRFGGLPWMQAAFYGIGAAVIAIIARGAIKLAERTVGRDLLLASVMLVNAAVVAWTERELVWVFALSGLLVPLFRMARPPVSTGTLAPALPAVGLVGDGAAWRGRPGDAGPGIHLLRQGVAGGVRQRSRGVAVPARRRGDVRSVG